MPGWMPCPECCEERPCIIVEDDFNRADSTNIGSKWVEAFGDAEIVDTQLEMPANTVVRTVKSHPVDDPTCHATVTLPDIVAGDDYMLLVNYDEESDSYLYGRYSWDGGDDVEISCGSCVGIGTPLEFDSTTTAAPLIGEGDKRSDTLNVCRSLNGIYAWAGSDFPAAWKCEIEDNGGRKAGLRAVAAGGAELKFDDFVWEEHLYTNPKCRPCACECEDFCVPKQMEMTFIVIACECSALNSFQESDEERDAGAKIFEFYFTDLPPDILPFSPSCLVSGTWSFQLQCIDGGTDVFNSWQLENTGGWHPWYEHNVTEFGWEDNGSWGITYPNPNSTCDPLYLEFGPFSLAAEDGCVYYITILPVYS